MVYVRKYVPKRSFANKKKRTTTLRRNTKRLVSRVRRNIPKNFTSIYRCKWQENWTPSTAATVNFFKQFTFTSSGMTDYAAFSSLYDYYKINAIKMVLRPRYDNFAGNDTTDTTAPGITNQGTTMVHVLRDMYGSYSAVGAYSSTTLNNFLENGRVRTYQGIKPITLYFQPTVDFYTNTSAIDKKIKPMWFPTADSSVLHYGPHIFLQDVNLTGTFNQSFDIFVTYYMSFKGMK